MWPIIEHFGDIEQFGEAVAAYVDEHRAPLNKLYMTVNSMRAGTAKGTYVWCARAVANTRSCGAMVVQKMGESHVAWVSDPDEETAQAFVQAIRHDGISLSSLVGPRNGAYRLAHALGGTFYERVRLGNHVLDQAAQLLPATGIMRRAGMRDLELLVGWHLAFIDECNLTDDKSRVTEQIRTALSRDETPYWIWDSEGRPVATAMLNVQYGMARVGGVYTAPAERQQGHAGALVSNLSSWAQAQGAEHAFLYTDLANPVSNGIYRKIGYRMIGEHVHLDRNQA
jgi:predicted GNAT family acetyltransferase